MGLIPPPTAVHGPEFDRSDATLLFSRLSRTPLPPGPDRYRLGDGRLEVWSSDRAFADRLRTLYHDCLLDGEPEDHPSTVRCTARVSGEERLGLVTIEDREPLDHTEFALDVFPDRGYREAPAPTAGWRMLASAEAPDGLVLTRGDALLVDRRGPWRALAGSLAVSRLMRLQSEVLFFHGASLSVAGRGVLILGGKGAGKTTLACALAVRGHEFLGDEIAALRIESRELLPVRRSITLRPGPLAGELGARLDGAGPSIEVYPDGTERRRVQPSEIFGGAVPSVAPLMALVFLRGFDQCARLTRFQPESKHARDLTPVGATLWGMAPARRAFAMLSVLTGTPCYDLWMGGVDETAALVESGMED